MISHELLTKRYPVHYSGIINPALLILNDLFHIACRAVAFKNIVICKLIPLVRPLTYILVINMESTLLTKYLKYEILAKF